MTKEQQTSAYEGIAINFLTESFFQMNFGAQKAALINLLKEFPLPQPAPEVTMESLSALGDEQVIENIRNRAGSNYSEYADARSTNNLNPELVTALGDIRFLLKLTEHRASLCPVDPTLAMLEEAVRERGVMLNDKYGYKTLDWDGCGNFRVEGVGIKIDKFYSGTSFRKALHTLLAKGEA